MLDFLQSNNVKLQFSTKKTPPEKRRFLDILILLNLKVQEYP